MAQFLIPNSIQNPEADSSEYDYEETETQESQRCPKCLSQNHDYNFLSRLGIPWLAHKSQLKLNREQSSPLELSCYLSTDKFDKDFLSLTSDDDDLER